MKPIIIVTPSITNDEELLKINKAYGLCVETAGGVALMPNYNNDDVIDELIDIADGILLSGGVDVNPSYFGEPPMRQIGEISPIRDLFELALVKRAANKSMPILGICRGAQILNIAFGGKVYQDIYSQLEKVIKHNQEMPKQYPSHYVYIKENSLLHKILGVGEINVNSLHHQAVSVLGDGFSITAEAVDGVIEAIENKEMPFCLGVQWHPEQMKDVRQQEIFNEFIRAARKYKSEGKYK